MVKPTTEIAALLAVMADTLALEASMLKDKDVRFEAFVGEFTRYAQEARRLSTDRRTRRKRRRGEP